MAKTFRNSRIILNLLGGDGPGQTASSAITIAAFMTWPFRIDKRSGATARLILINPGSSQMGTKAGFGPGLGHPPGLVVDR